MKKTILILVLGLVTIVSLAGCQFSRFFSSAAIQGSGKVITETRQVSRIDGVELKAVGKLVITKGDEESLTISGDDNIIPLIKTEVVAGKLVIDFINPLTNVNPLADITYNLTVVNLTSLLLSGAGDIQSVDLTADNLTVLVSGAGNIGLAGEVGTQDITISGAGNYNATDLKSQTTKVKISGAGNASIWVQKTLDITISGLGMVSYYGKPAVTQNISGAGKVEAKGNK
jgi:hypothetical protein